MPAPTALDDEAVAWLAGARRRARRMVVGGCVLLAGGFAAAAEVESWVEAGAEEPLVANVLLIAALVGGTLLAATGIARLAEARRQRRLLASHPWRRVTCRVALMDGGRTLRHLVEVDGTPYVLTIVTATRPALATIPSVAPTFDVAGPPHGPSVLRPLGSPHLLTARPPLLRLARTTRLWRELLAAFDEDGAAPRRRRRRR